MTDTSTSIRVNAGGGYDVSVGRGLIDRIGESIPENSTGTRVAVVTDSNVAELWLDRAVSSLERSGFTVSTHVFKAGEGSKNLDTFSEILDFFGKSGLLRRDIALALGGGVVGDITGFAAGCWMRGIRCVQAPTTLLAAVDSSVGGKTAIDLPSGKNLAGLFVQPSAVICDIDTFKTLTRETLADGYAEAIKMGILGDAELFGIFERGEADSSIKEIVTRSVKYKAMIVERDPREKNERKLLNLGHTAAHSIEALSGFEVTHGHAVAIGTAMAARASARLGLMDQASAQRIVDTLRMNGLPTSTAFPPDALYQTALLDKKRNAGGISLVIPRGIGLAETLDVSLDALREFFCEGRE